YATHYLIEAMLQSGMQQQAYDYLLNYWSGMTRQGADTFWEVYDPADAFASPYRFHPLNSACHAWSCTPVYFIGRYPEVFAR
ncbi:MAG: glycoside hydrolase, partial [Paludibacteraceae bacterium]|nr:glycoside hydrolase [Paludibacteraceae bacterium]